LKTPSHIRRGRKKARAKKKNNFRKNGILSKYCIVNLRLLLSYKFIALGDHFLTCCSI
jgi:hypothetical protein